MLQHKASDADNDDTRTMLFADMRLGLCARVCLCAQFVYAKNYSWLSLAISSHFRNGKQRNETQEKSKVKATQECMQFVWKSIAAQFFNINFCAISQLSAVSQTAAVMPNVQPPCFKLSC